MKQVELNWRRWGYHSIYSQVKNEQNETRNEKETGTEKMKIRRYLQEEAGDGIFKKE